MHSAPAPIRIISARVADLLALVQEPKEQHAPPAPAPTNEIAFTFGGSRYRAGGDFYDLNLVRLPGGLVLTAGGWAETMPPRPEGLRIASAEEIGNRRIAIAAPVFEGSAK